MILRLLDVYRSQIDQMTGPQIVQENGERPAEQREPARPKWGAIYRAPLPSDTWQAVHAGPARGQIALALGCTEQTAGVVTLCYLLFEGASGDWKAQSPGVANSTRFPSGSRK